MRALAAAILLAAVVAAPASARTVVRGELGGGYDPPRRGPARIVVRAL